MENASKALIMAGSVLIALMILGALILLFSNLNAYQETNVRNERSAQVVEFNNQYETYNRTDVRGSDLYSLLNRAIDYNERKSVVGAEGKEIAFEPITIVLNFGGKLSDISPPDGENSLITKNQYIISETTNEFENEIKDDIDLLESTYGASSLSNLAGSLTNIFIDTTDQTEQRLAVDRFNSVSKRKKISSWSEIAPGSKIRKDIYKYYEYIQFKRAHFDCTSIEREGESGVTYNTKTGRIIKMEFKYNGKME